MNPTSPIDLSPNKNEEWSVSSAGSEDWSDFSSSASSPNNSPQSPPAPEARTEQINIQALEAFYKVLYTCRSQGNSDPHLPEDVTRQFYQQNEITRTAVLEKIEMILRNTFPNYSLSELEQEASQIMANPLLQVNGTFVMEEALSEVIKFSQGEQRFMEFMEQSCGETKDKVIAVQRRLDYCESSDESGSEL